MAKKRSDSSGEFGDTEVGMESVEGTEELTLALEDARRSPGDAAVWDRLEELAAAAQRPDEVAALYREVLDRDLPPTLAASLGGRGARFHEEWLGEDSPELLALLGRVLALDPTNEWAFQRLTVAHTVAGRWDDLLAVYELAIRAATEADRRAELLSEAANAARDFAGLPDRAIGYLEQLVELKPEDGELAESLERLLERGGRWQDLIDFWKRRLPALPASAVAPARARIAETYLERLVRPDAALAEATELLAEGVGGDVAARLLERIAALEDADRAIRQGALARLREHYDGEGRAEDAVRTLEAAILLADPAGQVALHRETGGRLAAMGRAEAAMEHYATLLRLEPAAVDALLRLRELGKRTGDDRRFAEALEAAAQASEAVDTRVGLRMEAARARASRLDDGEGAIALYRMVLEEAEPGESSSLDACRRLAELLEAAGRKEEQLGVLEQLAGLEPEASARLSIVGRAAALADSLGQTSRALDLWWSRIEKNRADVEALDATVAILEREEDWKALVGALRQRIAAPVPAMQRRADWARVARVQADHLGSDEAAIATWREVEETFGQDGEVVDALTELFRRAGRWEELASLLDGAADRESGHVADMLALLGDAFRGELGEPGRALGYYLRAGRIEPTHAATLAGLAALLEVDECRAEAASALAEAYEATGRWMEGLGLLEHRLAGAPDDPTRVRLLRAAAETQERRAGDGAAALASLCRAMPLASEDESIEAEVLRLAEATGDFGAAVAALHETAAVAVDDGRRLRLRLGEAELAEARLGEPERALAAYLFVLERKPDRLDAAEGAVRSAGRLRDWARACAAVTASARARGELPASLVEELEEAAAAGGAHDDAAAALEAATREAAPDLEPAVGRALDRLAARWHEERRGDLDAAEAALGRAAAWPGEDVETLVDLARLRRRTPGRALFDTLLRLAGQLVLVDDLDPLHEAARLALGGLEDPALAVETLERLFREAARIWRAGTAARGQVQAGDAALWSLTELIRTAEDGGELGRAVALLSEGANLPLEAEVWREMRRRAARICAGPLEDRGRAIVLYRSILAETPDDKDAIRELGDACEAEGRLPELLALRQHELALDPEPDRRLRLRLDVARLVGELAARGGRLEALKANLSERPGHPESVDALVQMLEAARRHDELADLLQEQAARLGANESEAERAAALWSKVASLAEENLKDQDRAIHAHTQVADLVGSVEAFDALARLHGAKGDSAGASRWLGKRLGATEGPERVEIALRLARARLEAGQAKRAIAGLEAAWEESPGSTEVRDLLAEQYRAAEAYEPLARLLTGAVSHVEDPELLGAFAREAAGLYARLGSPDRAVLALEKASAVLPEDRDLKLLLADGLVAAERLDEAERLLSELIEAFGRRRSPERASLHHRLARVKRGQGDLEAALAQLEQASSMDMRNTAITGALAEASREAGQHDKAERTYRALLMVVRRQEPEDGSTVGAAEVFFELSRLARERGQEDQAEELLRLSLKTAAGSAAEMRRYKRALLERGQAETLLRALEMRGETVRDPAEVSVALADKAEVLEGPLGRAEEALEARLKAIEALPEAWAVHDAARALAKAVGQTARYAEALKARAEAVRRREDAPLATELLARLGAVYEEDLDDLEASRDAYGRMEGWGVRPFDARLAMARVTAAQGDADGATRLLERIVEEEDAPAALRAEARYRLGEVLLSAEGRAWEGVAALKTALEGDRRYDLAGAILRQAAAAGEPGAELLALYGQVARAADDPELLLDYLTKRSAATDVTLAELREAVSVATELDEQAAVDALLERALTVAEASDEGLAAALWVPIGLANRRKTAGDVPGALDWMRRAAEAAPDEAKAGELWRHAASIAAEANDLAASAHVYERLLEREPANRKVWEPLLDVLARLDDEERLVNVVINATEALGSEGEKNEVRLAHARFLAGKEGREHDTAAVLRTVLASDRGNAEARALLTGVFERAGFDEELSEILARQLEEARAEGDAASIHDLTLRLGALLERVRRDEAKAVYRRGLEVLPDDREIATALLELLGPEDDPRERLDLIERPLRTEEGPPAAERAIRLADEWAALGDDGAVLRVLKRGYEACPEDDEVRRRLETWYHERGQWLPLAELLAVEAARLADPIGSVALLRNAAAIHRDSLGDTAAAAAALAEARRFAPADLGLLADLAATRAEAADHVTAIEEVTEAIDAEPEGSTALSDLLRLRAQLRMAIAQSADAVIDLEMAMMMVGDELVDELISGLESHRALSVDREDAGAERAATLRLSELRRDRGQEDVARALLAGWLDRYRDDREALRMLRDLDASAGRWAEVAEASERLVALETGEAQVEAALALAAACDRLEKPSGARAALERVHRAQPGVEAVRDRLWTLYESIGARQELATMLVTDAGRTEDPDHRFELLRRAGALFVESEAGAVAAVTPLEEAARLRPDDHEVILLLADAYVAAGLVDKAQSLLDEAINGKGGKHAARRAELQAKMALVAGASGDREERLRWLNAALDSNKRDGYIAADLAKLALQMGDLDTAFKALRVITVSRRESSMSLAAAFLMQAKIAHKKGEDRQAVMWARKALSEDESLTDAADFLAKIEGR